MPPVPERANSTERLKALSDGVFAVILTIMVLDLKPPPSAALHALAPLWPVFLSYAISYLFIAIIWVNHHHLLGFAPKATPQLIWWNFAHIFMVSLVPATTAWMAAERFAAGPVFIYSLVFASVEVAYIAFEHAAFLQAGEAELPRTIRLRARLRSYIALGVFTLATGVSFYWPRIGLSLVCSVLAVYLSPRLPDIPFGRARHR